MKIEFDKLADGRIFRTRFIGPVGDPDLQTCYEGLDAQGFLENPQPHLVDGRGITDIHVTRHGMERLADALGRRDAAGFNHRVALLADRDLVFGMFRMWEHERSEIGGEAGVFRDFDEAVAWLLAED